MASTLVVEDGTGKADADSYNATAEVVAYAARWGKTFSGTDDELDQACRLATVAVDLLEPRFPSTRYLSTQALAWPRGWFYDRNHVLVNDGTVPTAIKAAHAELAIRVNGGDDLFPDVSNRVLRSYTHEVADAHRESTTFAAAETTPDGSALKRYPIVEKLLAAVLKPRTALRM